MEAMDRIIGYSNIKNELIRIKDILINTEIYRKLGADMPHGLLLYGAPGVGKTLMAISFIKDCKVPYYICRKNKSGDNLLEDIKKVFEEAAQNEKAIVLLDDMDKFSNTDSRYTDTQEYVTIQTCIDSVKEKNVYVTATVNSLCNLPQSLLRSGRFDNVLEVSTPRGRDAELIIEHYIKNKHFDSSVDIKNIARLMVGKSCADLETVTNEAAICAGYRRGESICMDDFMEAFLRMASKTEIAGMGGDEDDF